MSAEIKIQARSKSVIIDLKNHDRLFGEGIEEALYDIGEIVKDEIVRLIMTGPKTGRLYPRVGRPDHRASAPGQAPANDTGKLAKSVDYRVREREMEVGDQVEYGAFLENGTRKMRPRPHVIKAVNRTAGDALRILGRRVRHKIGRGR